MTWRSTRLFQHEFFVRGVREPVRRFRIGDRWVDVWIPRGTPSGLLVAHDGQNIFDCRTATHRQTWDAARGAVRGVARLGVTPPAVVGVWNGSTAQHPYQRGLELAPQKLMSASMRVDPRLADWFNRSQMCGDEYQSELAEVIVPRVAAMIGADVPVAMMGSSMGALATLYALGERPNMYSCGLAFSVHWPFGGEALVDALINHLPRPGKVRIWMQNGTGGLDSSYAPYQRRADTQLSSRGYVRDRDFSSRVLRRSGHNEWSWARRLPDAIEWWLRSRWSSASGAHA
jgi:predicted alpha/beta superfamily hydrolase